MSLVAGLRFPRPDSGLAWALAAAVMGVLMLWFGAMALPPLRGDVGSVAVAAAAPGALQVLLGLALLWPGTHPLRSAAALATALLWWSTLLLMPPSAWMQAAPYEGFPYMGAGAGALKHLGLGAIGFGLWARWTQRGGALRLARWLLWAGQLLVLVWLGAIKFTHDEAVGVEGLMRGNPLFAWLYDVFDMRVASNLIGSVELAIAALVALWPWRPRIAAVGLGLAIVAWLLSSTFLFTVSGWPPTDDTSQLLMKNLGMLAGALVLIARPVSRPAGASASL